MKEDNIFNYSHLSKNLHENVCWRLKNIPGSRIELYEYNKGVSQISFKKEEIILLKDYGIFISKLINYKNYIDKFKADKLGICVKKKDRRYDPTQKNKRIPSPEQYKAIIDVMKQYNSV